MTEKVTYNDDFIKDFTEIWNRHMANKPTTTPKGEWETIDCYRASKGNVVYMRVNKKLGLYMPELITGSVCESDIRDNEEEAMLLFNQYVAKAFSKTWNEAKKRKGVK